MSHYSRKIIGLKSRPFTNKGSKLGLPLLRRRAHLGRNRINHIYQYVVLEEGRVIGWIALSAVSSRCVYGGVAEVSVYIDEDYRRKGIGKLLLAEVITESENNGYWMLQAGIMPANAASVKLHESLGFRVVGYREKISNIHGLWQDNLLLDRRSKVVGLT